MMLRRMPGALLRLVRVVKHVKPDLIYTSQQLIDIELARLARTICPAPHVIHLHYSVAPWMGRHALKRIRNTPKLLAVSEFVRQTALLQGVPPGAVYTLPNTLSGDSTATPSAEARAALRSEFGWGSEARVVIAVGRLDPGKGHLALVEAFARALGPAPSARLLICGESTFRHDYGLVLKARADELGLGNRVVFAGHRKDVATLLCGANVFCLPTELEPFGLVFLEAMRARLPVVACVSGGVPEIVLQVRTGLMPDPNDRNALTEHLVRLLVDPQYAETLGRAGYQRLLTDFDEARITKDWVHLLRGFRPGVLAR